MQSDDIEQLLVEVDEYLARTGMAASTFGKKTVNDGKCIDRLRAGGRAWPETVEAIRHFMAGSKSEAA